MTQQNRRELIRSLAAGAALTTGASALASSRPADRLAERSASPAQRPLLAPAGGAMPGMVTTTAEVLLCRSWDSRIYLLVDDASGGFASVDPRGLAIAAACQAAGRRVAVGYWGHDAAAEGGLGTFAAVHLAVDPRDLPASPQA